MSVRLTGVLHDFYEFRDGFVEPEIGDLLTRPELDEAGRWAKAGNHTNLGYSGYFRTTLFADGGSRKIKNYRDLWRDGENRYAASQDQGAALERMRAVLIDLSGTSASRESGGWRIELER